MSELERLLGIMRSLRDPDSGCPWDIKQSFESIAPYTIEEAYEVADAIERQDHPGLCDELGDLLLQVVFHAQIAQDSELFDFDDVARGISDKMVRRHPHVFGNTVFADEQAQKENWESIKAEERAGEAQDTRLSALDGVALALPALMRAEKIQKRAARSGLDWASLNLVVEKLNEELAEFQAAMQSADDAAIEDELGDLFFTLTNIARHLKLDPEETLKKSTRKFEHRFRRVEEMLLEQGIDINSLDEAGLDQFWQHAKRFD